MLEMNVKEVRNNLSSILDKVEFGEEIVITRRGKPVARMINLHKNSTPLKSLKKFRETINITGATLSQTVIIQREEERF